MLPSRGTANGKSSGAGGGRRALLGNRVRHFQSNRPDDRPRERQLDGGSVWLCFPRRHLWLERLLADDEFQPMLLQQFTRHIQPQSIQRHVAHQIVDRLNDRNSLIADRHLIVNFDADVLRSNGEIGREFRLGLLGAVEQRGRRQFERAGIAAAGANADGNAPGGGAVVDNSARRRCTEGRCAGRRGSKAHRAAGRAPQTDSFAPAAGSTRCCRPEGSRLPRVRRHRPAVAAASKQSIFRPANCADGP